MNFKKMTAALVSGAMALSMVTVSAFAATVEMDTEYPGSWAASKCIPKADLAAVGGDVKITLTLETRNLANTADQFLIRPMDYDNGWLDYTPYCTSDTVVAKTDGMFCIPEDATSCEFVLAGDSIDALGESGLSFQVQNVTIKSAELEAGTPEGELLRVSDSEGKDYCFGKIDPRAGAAEETEAAAEETEAAAEDEAAAKQEAEEAEKAAAEEAFAEEAEVAEETAAPEVVVDEDMVDSEVQGDIALISVDEPVAVETVPAADTATAPVATGNTAAVSIAIVMAAAGAAALISKKK